MKLAEWEKRAIVPQYDPLQLNSGWLSTCYKINWYGFRSPVCPLASAFLRKCMLTQTINFYEEKWIESLMQSVNPKCPLHLQGIYWLRDHIQPTSLLTFHDCNWDEPTKLKRNFNSNWVKSNTLWGALSSFQFFVGKSCFNMPFEFSPNGTWIRVTFINTRVFWIYVFQNNTTLTRKIDGQKIQVSKGDLMRIDYENSNDPTSNITYMYLLQKIVIPKKNGYMKTLAYNEFMKRVKKENKELYFMKESKFDYDTLSHTQHTLNFSPTMKRL